MSNIALKIAGLHASRWVAVALGVCLVAYIIKSPVLSKLLNDGGEGSFVRIAPNEIAVCDIDAVGQIHRVGTSFTKAAWYQNQSPTQTNDETCGVFGLRDPLKARERRKYFQQAGTKATVVKWEPIIVGIVDAAVSKIKRDAIRGKADIAKWFTMMAADVISSLAWGEPFDMVKGEKKPQLIKDIEAAMILGGLRLELPVLYFLLLWIPLPAVRRFMTLYVRLTEAGMRAVTNTKAAPKGSAKTLFSNMYPEDGKQPFPDSVMADEAGNLIIAGSDSKSEMAPTFTVFMTGRTQAYLNLSATAMTLTYLVYSVLSNPAIRDRLITEISSLSDSPGWEELESNKYLNNVIEEALRLHAPVPSSLPRNAPPEGAILGGYKIPGGTVCCSQAYTLHRDAKVYPDPEQ
ncbi:hypothetical protein H2200_009171 [Cladophialophora chaetospira]|uniref:Cytochrome P450 n=1 Tax=Cladophialophora chaetospira TaxID=386627 RepID=A0AA38X3Q4_9EURO|nr:hypothetical protein H2200_009171 [Cladophialophora chaetospira]